jgi:hypothetical protein
MEKGMSISSTRTDSAIGGKVNMVARAAAKQRTAQLSNKYFAK